MFLLCGRPKVVGATSSEGFQVVFHETMESNACEL